MNSNIIIILLILIIIIIFLFKKNKEYYKNNKYFKEFPGNNHLDIRYGKKNITNNEILLTLKDLLKKFVKYSKINNIKPVLMHGSLIGYHFNKHILPWDDDIDMVLVDEKSINNIKKYETDDILIDINPNYKNRDINDKNNKIDGRVISKKNGVFIDLTFFWKNKDKLYAKDKHSYQRDTIFPLKKNKFENVDIYLPNNIEKCLVKEYGKKVLLPYYKNWVFKNNKWIKK